MNKYKYNELHGKIIAKFGTLGPFADALEISYCSVLNKLVGRTPWKTKEIKKISELLNFTAEDTSLYFLMQAFGFSPTQTEREQEVNARERI